MTVCTVVAGRDEAHFLEVMDELPVMLRSLRAAVSAPPPVVVITTRALVDRVAPLLSRVWPNKASIEIVPEEVYAENGKDDPRYYKLEAHRIDDDRVLVLDTDLIFTGPVNELLADRGNDFIIAAARERRRDVFNSGMVIINREVERQVHGDVYGQLLRHPHDGGFGNDQNILNSFFFGRFTEIDGKFNRLVTELEDEEEVVGIHLCLKPWWVYNRARVSSRVAERAEEAYRRFGGTW